MAFGLFSSRASDEYGVVMDVGSGSVGVAIVRSISGAKVPEIVWSSRIQSSSSGAQSEERIEQDIVRTIGEAFDVCAKKGVLALVAKYPRARISRVQVGVCAPWSHTVTKTARLRHTKSFPVTAEVLRELSATAMQDVRAGFNWEELSGLSLASQTVLSTAINGYDVDEIRGKSATEVTGTYLIDLVRASIAYAVSEHTARNFPKANLMVHSFMRYFYGALCAAQVDAQNACLIDVTNEATEIGFVENGVLMSTFYVPMGIRTLARAVVATNRTPIDEAASALRLGDATATDARQKALKGPIAQYEQTLKDAFQAHIDFFTIPKTIFLHTDNRNEAFFTQSIGRVAALEGKIEPKIHPTTSGLFGKTSAEDTALLLSAHVFHQRPYECTW